MDTKSPHIHRDGKVTLERLDAFGDANREVHVDVLAELRRRAGDDVNDVQSSIMVGAFGALTALFIAPKVSAQIASAGGGAEVAALAIGVATGVVIAIVLIPVVIFAVVRTARRERSTLWLRAYEDELQRRWLRPGRSGRAWRRLH